MSHKFFCHQFNDSEIFLLQKNIKNSIVLFHPDLPLLGEKRDKFRGERGGLPIWEEKGAITRRVTGQSCNGYPQFS